MTINLFIPLIKVDAARREIWGIAAIEQPDRSREIMDYELSKPNFIKWSETIRKASGGKSLGNVRDSHSTSAIGKVIALEPDDTTKAFRVGVKVVDDNAWRKVEEGVFTGFSIGGSYGKRTPDLFYKDHTRYEAIPTELSLVDVPCIPDAQFEFIKSNGESQMKKFAQGTDKLAKQFPPAKEEEPDEAESEKPSEEETPAEDQSEAPADEGTAKDKADTSAGETDPAQEDEATQEGESKPDEMEAGMSEDPNESEAGVAPEGQGLSAEGVKEIIIALLMELGLVQQQDGAFKAVHSAELQKAEGKMQKAELKKELEAFKLSNLQTLNALTADLAKTIVTLETLEKRGAGGPVLREVAPLTAQLQADTQRADLLIKMANDATDPNVQQSLRNEAAKLQIKQIQNT